MVRIIDKGPLLSCEVALSRRTTWDFSAGFSVVKAATIDFPHGDAPFLVGMMFNMVGRADLR
jgi:hypothetical protein